MDELILMAQAGDEEAFANMILYIKDDLYKIAKTRIANETDIEDAIQETMIETYKSIKKLNDPNKFKKWVIKILINKCNRIYRRKYKTDISIDEYNVETLKFNNIIDVENKLNFYDIIKILNYEERLIIILYYMEDYSNAQKELTEAVNQKSTEGMLLLGMVYRAQGDTSNARSMYQQYVSADGSDPAKGYNGLSLCDMDDGSYDSALENISKGLEDASTEEMQDLLFNEIVVYEKKLDFSTALSKMQEYIKMFPDDENAAKELTFLQSRNGELSNDTASDTTENTDAEAASDAGDAADTSDEAGEEEY